MIDHEDEQDAYDEEEDEPVRGDDYDPFAYYYDLEYQQVKADLDFYREMARRAGANARILELACGSGRVGLPLLQAGFRYTGLDMSEKMLELARRRLSKLDKDAQARAAFVQGDMRDLDAALGNAEYDLIFVAINSFMHMLTQEDQLACLRSIRRHLAPAGLFIIDVFNPEEKESYPADGRMEYNGAFYNPERHSTVHVFLSTLAHPAEQRRDYHYFYDETISDGTVKRTVARLTLRYIYRFELQLLLERASLAVEDLYGSYDFDEFGEGSSRIIYLCRRG
ncbi:MAG TPA: class I SAM-dependent methyltransferase [Chloroflexia bacterium]|nr:class I SAM-dependent methyltransferase [Chloroflexia bacterium]